ncbi:MAG: ABC transporter ATP-binding protein [Acidobacteriota bacterium]
MDTGHPGSVVALLTIENLVSTFDTPNGTVRAVDDVSLHVDAGEIVGLVGESGCGKTVLALSVLRLLSPPGCIAKGRILWKGRDLLGLRGRELRQIRGAQIAMIFQEPGASLNPVFTVGSQISETLRVHRRMSRAAARERAVELLRTVAIPEPERRVDDYPHQMSGGMQQRVMIALALSCDPDLIIADEATTALDVTIQLQILQLLADLRRDRGLAVLLITHDLGVVAEIADRVAVMYAGRVVEESPATDLFRDPKHPYTAGLLASRPGTARPGPDRRLAAIPGRVPDLADLPAGCRFSPRCPDVFAACREVDPPLYPVGTRRVAACEKYVPDGPESDHD